MTMDIVSLIEIKNSITKELRPTGGSAGALTRASTGPTAYASRHIHC